MVTDLSRQERTTRTTDIVDVGHMANERRANERRANERRADQISAPAHHRMAPGLKPGLSEPTRDCLCTALHRDGHISAQEESRLTLALATNSETVGTLISRLGILSDDAARAAIADVMGLAPFTVDRESLFDHKTSPLAADYCRTVGLVPLEVESRTLVVAMTDPSDFVVSAAVGLYCGQPLRPVPVDEDQFEALFERVFGGDSTKPDDALQTALLADSDSLTNDDLARLEDLASNAPVIHCVEAIMSQALREEASDVHLIVVRDGLAVRYRIDGSLHEKRVLSTTLGNGVVLRLKVLAGLDIAERRIPQDGRIRMQVAGMAADVRLSTMPQTEGEGAVLRFLKHVPERLQLAALGFPEKTVDRLTGLINSPEGLVLVSGPTGSGKTTTLYAALRAITRGDVNIATIENPVEQRIDGIAQVEINPAIGFDFPTALRAMLRQDPDVILLGEIRDRETAETANRAALTGHLVLSTIHTDRAVSTIPRLLDMGVEDFLLASTLKAVLGQRLVRRNCLKCSVASPMSASQAAIVANWAGAELDDVVRQRHYSGTGCDECGGSGFRGRISVSELLVVDARMQAAIRDRADTSHLDGIAHRNGFRSMAHEALALCFDGTISLADALRIIPPAHQDHRKSDAMKPATQPKQAVDGVHRGAS